MKRNLLRSLRRGACLALWLALPVAVAAQPRLHGVLSGTLAAASYVVDGDCVVPPGASLEIAPGTHLSFAGSYTFTVRGSLVAAGEADAWITFTANLAQHPAGWSGLRFIDADSSRFEYCVIEHARTTGAAPASFGGGAYLVRSPVTFTRCVFRANSARLGAGLYAYAAGLELNECRVEDNTAAEQGGALYLAVSSARLGHCVLNGNTATLCGGAIYTLAANPAILHSTLFGNAAPAGSCAYAVGSQPQFSHSIVCASSGSAALYADSASGLQVDYCDLHGNEAGDAAGPGAPTRLGRMLRVNANGDSCDLYYNILLNPAFVDEVSGDFHLTADSPCLDAGNPAEPPDPDGSAPDLGAFHFGTSSAAPDRPVAVVPDFGLEPAYPNPFNGGTQLAFRLERSAAVELIIFDILGRSVRTVARGRYESGLHTTVWPGDDEFGRAVPSGIYLCVLRSGSARVSQKLICLR